MELEKISISGISDVYAVSAIKKEFKKAVNQPWKNSEPYPEYQKKLLADLAVLDIEKEKAIDLAAFEKLTNEKDLYSIHRPNSRKNVRIIYTIIDRRRLLHNGTEFNSYRNRITRCFRCKTYRRQHHCRYRK